MMETVTVAELFEEELEAIQDYYDKLLALNTKEALIEAESLSHVIHYFEKRLNDDLGDLGNTDRILH